MSFDVIMGPDGILRITLSGDLDQMIIERLRRELGPFVEASTSEQPLKSIMFFEQLERVSPVLRRYLTSLNQDRRIGKTAYIQPPRHVRVMEKFIQKATGRDNIAIFDHEIDALQWFQSHQG